ncbi:MAG: DUF5915 domain-containing protein [Rickettsiales bacterium]|nr:DUF5915 domain-containing protein [Rickettsiales bacterium]
MTHPQSVHLSDFPNVDDFPSDRKLIATMDKVRSICNAALAIRNEENIRIRQPLQSLLVVAPELELMDEYTDIIKDELNVKHVTLSSDLDEYAELQLNINFPVLGKRLPEKMKLIIAASKKGEWTKLANGNVRILDEELSNEECSLRLVPKNSKGAHPLASNDALVILDLDIDDMLHKEGIARDIVRLIQQSRKSADLHVSDFIDIVIETESELVKEVVELFSSDNSEYSIVAQTLASSISIGEHASCSHRQSFELDGGHHFSLGFDVVLAKKTA